MNDRWAVRGVVLGLFLIGMAVVVGVIILNWKGQKVDASLIGIGSGAVSALAPLLATTRVEPVAPPESVEPTTRRRRFRRRPTPQAAPVKRQPAKKATPKKAAPRKGRR